MEQSSSSRIISALIVGVALVVFSYVLGQAYRAAHAPDRRISVTGSAERTVTSDMAKWSMTLSRPAAADGLAQANTALLEDIKKVTDYASRQGLKPEEISIQIPLKGVICEFVNGQSGVGYDGAGGQYCTTQLLGYNLSQTLVFESKNVDALTKIAHDAMRVLGDQGVSLTGGSVEYYLQALPTIKLDMLAEATKNAQARADKIASSTGARIGRVESAGMGVFQVTTVNSTDISDYGTYDTTSIHKKVTAIVRTDFLLE
jgi:hypothetical protein